MKTLLCTGIGLLCAQALPADPIDSRVIHNYDQFGVGYAYSDGDDVDGHGVIGSVSMDLNNFLIGAGGNYTWFSEPDGFDDVDAQAWSAGGFAGYILRLMENHINIIPRVGVSYNELTIDFDGPIVSGSVTEDFVGIEPGITLSYAINNHISLNGGYTYIQDLDDDIDVEAHTFSVGTRIALAEHLGLNLNAFFEEEQGFSGAAAILSWHY